MTAPTPKRFDSVALSELILTGHSPHFGQESLLALGKDTRPDTPPQAFTRLIRLTGITTS